MEPPQDATIMLQELCTGDQAAAARLLPLIYSELRGLAGGYFRAQAADHTLQPTALVHEAYLRLINQTGEPWKSRAHFFAVAATAMRQILTDHARRRNAEKRGGDWQQLTLAAADEKDARGGAHEIDVIALDEVLHRLEALDPRKHRVVELRFFGGLSVEEVATVMELSKTTVESDWRAARAWLSVELAK
ncbi:MAG: sigma-70 family RNA polymerase sigma factor [Pyrinomonadaceae bacterium]|nr:sigma-70 family RNA polymerase sigma factor [Phycisphaerales bacterium]